MGRRGRTCHTSTTLPDGAWTLYAHGTADATTYASALTPMTTVQTCEDWARMWNTVHRGARSDVRVLVRKKPVAGWSFFRDPVRPEWEHPSNEDGSTLSARVALAPDRADALWTALLCDCARGRADDAVLGVQISHKWVRHTPALKIDIWLAKDAPVEEVHAWLTEATTLCFEAVPRRR